MNELKNIVLLIDADNTPYPKMQDVIQEISVHGRIVVKRAYGNWKKDSLKNWENVLRDLAISAVQQFDYVAGKNATDIALVIDAMKLLYENKYDAFVIAASDCDYTPLTITLRESGVYVMAVGRMTTPEAFRNSCDEFIILENIGADSDMPPEADASDIGDIAIKSYTSGKELAISEKNQPESNRNVPDEAVKEPPKKQEDNTVRKTKDIHKLIRLASEKYQDQNGYTDIGIAGSFIKRAKPDFDVRTYGFKQLSMFFEAWPQKYEIKKINKNIIVYKCK